jgi:hypothetical protein
MADLTAISADCLENVGTSTSHNPMGLHGLLQGQLYLFYLNAGYSLILGRALMYGPQMKSSDDCSTDVDQAASSR